MKRKVAKKKKKAKKKRQLKLALIKNSNLFLMPSIIHKNSVEGFGITFVEAASYGEIGRAHV